MSKADEMFDKLEYKKLHENESEVKYISIKTLLGEKFENILIISKISKNIFHIDNIEHQCIGIDFKLLQAINKKVKELGWLDE